MSISSSIPRMMNTGSTGRLNEATVPSRMTSDALGTPATPLEVSIRVKTMRICWPSGMWMPAACATNTDASDR
jgi:hypothetical protein